MAENTNIKAEVAAEVAPQLTPDRKLKKKGKGVSYAKWGYIFLIPFFLAYITCTLVPQFLTIYNSFFENYMAGLKHIGPEFVGLENYIELFSPDRNDVIRVFKYAGSTMVMWIMGAIPQMGIALLLAVWFTSFRLNIKGQGFFKTVIYLPNLIMASAFSMLFFALFSRTGPIFALFDNAGLLDQHFDFLQNTVTARSLVALMNFLMWFGNSTLLLMAGIMGIDQSIFEAATIDGAKSSQVFFKVTVPLLMPILLYTIVTAMIGGVQMYDVPQVLTDGTGAADRTAFTLIMYLNGFLNPSKNYGMGGALSVVIFAFTGVLSLWVFSMLKKQTNEYDDERLAKMDRQRIKAERKLAKKGVR